MATAGFCCPWGLLSDGGEDPSPRLAGLKFREGWAGPGTQWAEPSQPRLPHQVGPLPSLAWGLDLTPPGLRFEAEIKVLPGGSEGLRTTLVLPVAFQARASAQTQADRTRAPSEQPPRCPCWVWGGWWHCCACAFGTCPGPSALLCLSRGRPGPDQLPSGGPPPLFGAPRPAPEDRTPSCHPSPHWAQKGTGMVCVPA